MKPRFPYLGWFGQASFFPIRSNVTFWLGDLQHRGQLPDAVRQRAGTKVTVAFLDHCGVRVTQLGNDQSEGITHFQQG